MAVMIKYGLSRITISLAILLLIDSGIVSLKADSITLSSKLVLGTSKQQEGSKKVSESIRKRLSKVFKWSNYYELTNKNLTIEDGNTKTTKLSKNASIKVSNRKNGNISVSLFSGGKMLLQKTQRLRSGSYMVLAGKSTGDSAWFIVISQSN